MFRPSRDRGIERVLRDVVGPAPWYWKTFPLLSSSDGRSWTWQLHGFKGPHASSVTLGLAGPQHEPRLAVAMYVRPFAIRMSLLGLWFENRKSERLELVCVELDRLQVSSVEALTAQLHSKQSLFYAGGAPVWTIHIPTGLSEGLHEIQFPKELAEVNELLLVADRPSASTTDASCQIIEVHPSRGTVRLYPQRWFTAAKFDIGYQWITRVARDPETGRIVGDGIRISPFELSADGCELASD